MNVARITVFLAAAAILGVGFFGADRMGKEEGLSFLLGCLTLGGGLMICGLFSLKMPWHGIMGAGALALLGFGRGVLNFPDFAGFLVGETERGVTPALELAVTLLCAMVMARILRTWAAERARRARES